MALRQAHLRVILNQDGAVILDTNAGRITTLNSMGAFVWQALDRGDAIEAIAENLARASGEPTEAVREDLVGFMEALKTQDLWTD